MKLIHNDAIEFILAMNRFGIRNKGDMSDYPQMDELKQWCRDYENKLSPFLLNDISLICEKTIIITLYLVVKVSESNNIYTAEEFLDFLSKLTYQELKDDLITRFLDESIENVSKEKIYNQILNDGLHIGYDTQEETDLLYAFILDPQSFLQRLIITYRQFYELVYLPSRDKFNDFKEEKYIWHNEHFQEDAIPYLNALGLTGFLKNEGTLKGISFFYSLFADNEISVLWESKTVIIGANTDIRIKQLSAMKQTDLFFSLLGDPKRLEILRLTSIRPWYSSELATHFDLKPATLSYHINKLVDADLLTITKGKAKRFYYSLNVNALKNFLEYVSKDLIKPIL